MSPSFWPLVLCAALLATSTAGLECHGVRKLEGKHEFNWAGIFEVTRSEYTWSAQKVDAYGAYAEPSMKMAVLPAVGANATVLNNLRLKGNRSLEQMCTKVSTGGTIIPEEDKCFKLIFDDNVATTTFKIQTSNFAAVAFFTEHYPTEFENDTYYYTDDTGTEIQPKAELAETDCFSYSYAQGLVGAAVLGKVIALAGVVLAARAF